MSALVTCYGILRSSDECLILYFCFILQFMKRTKEQQELDIENEERQEMFKNEISDAMRAQG